MNEERLAQPLPSRRVIYSQTAHQCDVHWVARKILRHYVKSNCAARDRIVAEYAHFAFSYCDISPTNSFALVWTGVFLQV